MKCKEEKSMEINSNVNTMAGINLMYRGIKKGTFLFISKVNEELKRTILSITPVWRFQEVRTSFHPNSLKVNSAILNVVRKAERQDNEEEIELINTFLNLTPKNARRPWRAEEKNEFTEGNSHGK